MKSIVSRLNKQINWVARLMEKYGKLANILFIISSCTLIVLLMCVSSRRLTNDIPELVGAFALFVLALFITKELDISHYLKNSFTYIKVLISVAIAAIICYRVMLGFYSTYFYTVIHGGDTPNTIKNIYDSILITDFIKNTAIKSLVGLAGIISVYSVSIIIILIINIITDRCSKKHIMTAINKEQIKHFENYLFVFYLLIGLLLVYYHEPWRDEAQFWLEARDGTLKEILSNVTFNAIPPLWTLFLVPFAKIGLPYYPTINLLSFTLVSFAAWLFLKKSPFSRLFKVILLFNPAFLYCYSTIARNYSLIPLLIVLISIFYRTKFDKPLRYGLVVGLLLQTHVIMLGMSAVLSVVWLFEVLVNYRQDKNRSKLLRNGCGLCLPLASIFYYLYFYSFAIGNINFGHFHVIRISGLFTEIGSVFGNQLNINVYDGLLVAIIVFLSLVSILKDRRCIKYVIITAFSIFFQVMISAFFYPDGNYRSISIFLIIMWAIWQIKAEGISQEIKIRGNHLKLTSILCILSIMGTFGIAGTIKLDIPGLFSDSRNTAEYIESEVDPGAVILTTSEHENTAVIAYLPQYTFYNDYTGESFTFKIWNNDVYGPSEFSYAIKTAQSLGATDGFYYLIPNGIYSDDIIDQYNKLYETSAITVRKEEYILLYINLSK